MSLVQYIYNTTNVDGLTPDRGVLISVKSVEICDRLAMTGRVFSNRKHALSITEGPAEVMRQYLLAVQNQPHVQAVCLQGIREIETREFEDYSVWLDIDHDFDPHPNVHPMTANSLALAMPNAPSVRLRVMTDAFFVKGRLVA